MNYLNKMASFVLSLTLLSSPLWCMEEDTTIKPKTAQKGSFNNLLSFMKYSKNILPDELNKYIGSLFLSSLKKDALEYNFQSSNTFPIKFNRFTPPMLMTLSPNKKIIFIGYPGTCAGFLYNTETGKELTGLRGHCRAIPSVAFSPDNNMIITGSWDHTACLWDINTGKKLHWLEGHSNSIVSVAWSPNGKWVITGSLDHTARLWDAVTGEPLGTLNHTAPVRLVAVSPDGQTVVTGSADQKVCLWDVKKRTRLKQLELPSAALSLACSPDSKTVIIGLKDGTAYLYNTQTKDLKQLKDRFGKCHSNEVISVTFSPNGKFFITESKNNGIACLWNAQTGEFIIEFMRWYANVAFSSDSRVVLIVSVEKTVCLWDVETGNLITKLEHPDHVVSVAFGPDDEKIIVGLENKTVCLWKWSHCKADNCTNSDCKALNWIVNKANFPQTEFLNAALQEKKNHGVCTISENSSKHKILMSMPDYVQKYVTKSYQIKITYSEILTDSDSEITSDSESDSGHNPNDGSGCCIQ